MVVILLYLYKLNSEAGTDNNEVRPISNATLSDTELLIIIVFIRKLLTFFYSFNKIK